MLCQSRQSLFRNLKVVWIFFDSNTRISNGLSSSKSGAGSAEWIEHDPTSKRENTSYQHS